MALTDDNSMVLPVQPMNYGNNGGFGFGGDWAWILLLLVLGGGWGGFGGFGAGAIGAGMVDGFGLYPWMNNSQNINDGFRAQALESQVGSISNAITAGFGDVNTALCGGFAGVNASINNAQNSLTQQMYTNQLADLERSFAAQTANTAGLTNLSAQLAQCCCDNRQATNDVKYTIAQEACASRATSTANTQAILDKLCSLEIDNYKRENDQLRSQLQFANMQASQVAQTQAIEASQTAQTQFLVNRIAPYPQPAIVYGYNTEWVNPLPTTTAKTGV